ncbi:tyrosine-type recombinase/integrase [Nocardioides sp. SLBN-35]|uniref:tyrosine-type recombinase/integrase n=1 Tax=Nocardioides sp. SLBN-35 TaxID=2768445 RepID=UPI001358ED6D|nr:tyrosine-type recombinase/integrase [Nocardioides sp. SLBN-35]
MTAPNDAVVKAPSTFKAKIDAEEWVKTERRLMEDPTSYVTAQVWLEAAKEQARLDAANTFAVYAERYLASRDLRPKTIREYRGLLERVLGPAFGDVPSKQITCEAVRTWHTALPKETPAANAAAYRFLRSVMGAAEDDELIERNPVRIQKASTARVNNPQRPSRSTRWRPSSTTCPSGSASSSCSPPSPACARARSSSSAAATSSRPPARSRSPATWRRTPTPRRMAPARTVAGSSDRRRRRRVRTVHLPPAFLTLLRAHLLAHTAPGANGLLFTGERKDHMSARYLLDRYKVAREAASRPDLTIHGLQHSALTLAGRHGATAAELQARASHASQAAMAIYQHATVDRDRELAGRLGTTVAGSKAWTELLGDP